MRRMFEGLRLALEELGRIPQYNADAERQFHALRRRPRRDVQAVEAMDLAVLARG